ncbi:glutamine-dependent carbamoyl-phosphate synthetase [Trypanosoma rangeli]|uniref:Glutamine-dependent carbamoyl-phosphate synthetase n=1 Tax=Trypanosoma rangeli TaxID=5698 RepID=A0A3R7KMC8_TRYRA|nr:glutamine-dependent carbamoyl-phosphate synthetase [Trypanosoma rangeli]RNE97374.1 glutamine-dependent carbamoyl-phosphate synthetase [Trypanosoma rangeli]|eukprot:RNE97374.1 glutamine-dependent carbamoyl-phosphate synthetase [Trypanosoma rangeli]
MEAIQRALQDKPVHRRPLLMFLEQLPLNCSASRFTGRANMFKRCEDLTAPVVVPLYRRVLAAMAWHLNIPVVPTQHFFKGRYTYCTLSDGVHMDPPCMMMAQHHIWNTYLLLRREKVIQGLPTGSGQLPNAMRFVEEEEYVEWLLQMDGLDMGSTRRRYPFRGFSVIILLVLLPCFLMWAYIFGRCVLLFLEKRYLLRRHTRLEDDMNDNNDTCSGTK